MGVWDPAQLARCFDNLLSNAVKFSPNGGAVIVTLVRDSGWAIVGVTDHGVGIPTVEQARLFERFFRASNVDQNIAGTGLGLRGVRDIIESYGWHGRVAKP